MNQLREKSLQDQRAAKEAEQRKNDLIVYLAHDLRTPLTSVIGYLTLLKEEPQLSMRCGIVTRRLLYKSPTAGTIDQ